MRRFIVATLAALTVIGLTGAPVRADIIQPQTTPFQAQYKDVNHPEQGLAAFTVIATGLSPGQQVFVEECDGNAPSVPNWDPTINCDSGSSPAPVIADGSGVAYFDSTSANHKFVPFKGASPQENFNCLGLDDPPLASSDSLPDFKNCQVRVSSDNASATDDQQFFGLVLPDTPGSPLVAQFEQANHPSRGLSPITISASGFTPGQQVFVEQCDGVATTAPGWDPTIDCDNGLSPAPVVADSSGNVTFDANDANHRFIPFRGASPQGDFNCVAPSDPPGNNGLTDYKSCNIRVSGNNAAPTSDQRFFGLTVPAGVPDAPTIGTATQTDGGATVAFTPGPDNGYPVSTFTASCTSPNGGATGGSSTPSSPITVTGLTNGRTYTCTVTAANGAGTSQPSAASNSIVHALAPDAPANVTANAANNAAQVVFTAPDFDGPAFDNGSAVTSLTASCTSSGTGAFGLQTGTSSPILVTGLTKDQPYTCTVDATNGVGTSVESAPSNQVVPEAVPDAPIIGTATRGNASATVTYTAGSDNGSPITSFTAVCTSSGTGASGSNTGGPTDTSILVPGLTNGQPYTCTVSATNSFGPGPVSAASNSFVPATTPDVPTAVVIARGNASVGVSFTAGSNGGLTAEFDASCTSSGTGAPGSSINQAGSPITVTGLTNGQPYTCTVTAHNAIGSSGPSGASNSITPGAVPDAPTSVVASRSGSGSLSVGFTPGNGNGFATSTFTARCASSDMGAASPVSTSAAASPVVVNGLTNGDTYTCTVHGTNSIGTGAESSASNAIIPATVPSAPTIGTVSRSGAGLRVPFTPGTDNGLPITSFTARCTASRGTTGTMSGGSSPIVVTGVTLGRSYMCTVRAANGVGSGPASSPSNAVVPSVVPGAPTAVSATSGSTATTTGSLSVKFALGAGNGSAITTNTATCTSSSGGATRTASGATSPITVAAATTAKTYTCRVKSTNDIGTGPASAASAAVVVGSPAAPTGLSLSSGSTTAATGALHMSFTPGADNGGTPTAPQFTATCISSNGGATATGTSDASPVTINGATTGKSYTCRVKGHNARGTGLASVASNAVVTGAPAKVAQPAVTKSSAGKLLVTFTVLTTTQTNGSPLTTPKYTASCTSNNGGVAGSATGTGSGITVAGLTAGKSYSCTVTAHNARGFSPTSLASAPVAA